MTVYSFSLQFSTPSAFVFVTSPLGRVRTGEGDSGAAGAVALAEDVGAVETPLRADREMEGAGAAGREAGGPRGSGTVGKASTTAPPPRDVRGGAKFGVMVGGAGDAGRDSKEGTSSGGKLT